MNKRRFLVSSMVLIVLGFILISALVSSIENIGTEKSALIPMFVSVVTFYICYRILKNKKYIQFLKRIQETDVEL